MNTQEQTNVLRKAIATYGVHAQIRQLHEEMGELMQAINKMYRINAVTDFGISKPSPAATAEFCITYNNLIKEIADVQNALEQIKLMTDPEQVEFVRIRQIERLNENL